MWPKLLMQYLPQLIELLPHVSRVVPAADKYLAQRGANDQKLDTLATSVRDDLGRVAKAHVSMATQLDTFAGQVTRIGTEAHEAATEARLARLAAEALSTSVDLRLTRAERSVSTLRILLILTVLMLAATLILLAVLVSHTR